MDDPRLVLGLVGIAALSGCGAVVTWVVPTLTWVRLGRRLQQLARASGMVIGLALAAAVLGMLWALGVPMLLSMGVSLLLFLTVGLYLPGADARAQARRARALRRQAPDFLHFVALHLEDGMVGDVTMIRMYSARPRASVAAIQEVLQRALAAHVQRGRGNVWERVVDEVRPYDIPDLTEAIHMLVQSAEHDRRQAAPALRRVAERMTQTLLDDWRAGMQRREWALLGVTASALMLGMLPAIIYVLTDGFQVVAPLLGVVGAEGGR